jgi:hypothetical protein
MLDPASAEAPARAAAEQARRIGERFALAMSLGNLASALLLRGEWHEIDVVTAGAIENDGLGDNHFVMAKVGLLEALRGETDRVDAVLASLESARSSEDVQDRASVVMLEAFAAAAKGRWSDALAAAQAVIGQAPVLGIQHESIKLVWAVASRAARELNDSATLRELIGLLDSHPIGHLPLLLRAERELASAWLKAKEEEPEARAAFDRAIQALRPVSPYHLANGLVEQAGYLIHLAEFASAARALEEARSIGLQLPCPPIVARVDALSRELADSTVSGGAA